jgi:N-succinyldiaminopimelate aminotransferase
LEDSGVHTFRPSGTYFLQFDVRSFGYADADQFCRELPEQAGVVAIPITAFCDHREVGRHLARLAFCKGEGVVLAAAGRLSAFAASRRGVAPAQASAHD